MAAAVDRVAVGVGVAGGVEPDEGHAFAEVRAGEQTVDELFVGVGCVVGDEGFDFGGGWRQAGEVEREAADERAAIGFGRGLRAFSASRRARTKWSISLRGQAVLSETSGTRRFHGRDERPVLGVGRTLFDPALENRFCSGLSAGANRAAA